MATGDGGFIGIPIAVALFSIPAAQPVVKVKPPPAVAAYLLTRENAARGQMGSFLASLGDTFLIVRKTIDITYELYPRSYNEKPEQHHRHPGFVVSYHSFSENIRFIFSTFISLIAWIVRAFLLANMEI